QAFEEAEALAEAVGWPGPRALFGFDEAVGGGVRVHLSEFTEGLDLGTRHWGTAQGNAAELAPRLRSLAEDGYRVVLAARGHGSLQRAREVVGNVPGLELVEAPLA